MPSNEVIKLALTDDIINKIYDAFYPSNIVQYGINLEEAKKTRIAKIVMTVMDFCNSYIQKNQNESFNEENFKNKLTTKLTAELTDSPLYFNNDILKQDVLTPVANLVKAELILIVMAQIQTMSFAIQTNQTKPSDKTKSQNKLTTKSKEVTRKEIPNKDEPTTTPAQTNSTSKMLNKIGIKDTEIKTPLVKFKEYLAADTIVAKKEVEKVYSALISTWNDEIKSLKNIKDIKEENIKEKIARILIENLITIAKLDTHGFLLNQLITSNAFTAPLRNHLKSIDILRLAANIESQKTKSPNTIEQTNKNLNRVLSATKRLGTNFGKRLRKGHLDNNEIQEWQEVLQNAYDTGKYGLYFSFIPKDLYDKVCPQPKNIRTLGTPPPYHTP